MSNPNPNPATRFKPGEKPPGNGRPKASKDRITRAFLEALADDFQEHGRAVVATVRETDPSTYMRVFAGFVPKEIEISEPLRALSTEQLTAAIEALTLALSSQIAPSPPIPDPEHQTVN